MTPLEREEKLGMFCHWLARVPVGAQLVCVCVSFKLFCWRRVGHVDGFGHPLHLFFMKETFKVYKVYKDKAFSQELRMLACS